MHVGVTILIGQAAKAKRKEKEVAPKEDQKAKKARLDVKKDTVGLVCRVLSQVLRPCVTVASPIRSQDHMIFFTMIVDNLQLCRK